MRPSLEGAGIRRAVACLVLSGFVLAVPQARAQTQQPAGRTALDDRAAVHPTYARLVFAGRNGRPGVPVTSSIAGNVLTIRFHEPVQLPVAALDRGARGYATDFALSADGLVLTARLLRSVEARAVNFDPATWGVDLVRKPPEAPKPAVAPPKLALATPAPPASAAPPVAAGQPPVLQASGPPLPLRLRVTSGGGADRISFNLPRRVQIQARELNNRAVVAFSQPIRLNIGRVNAEVPAALRTFALADNGGAFSFALPTDRHLQLQRDGGRMTIVIGPGAPGPGVIGPPPPPPPPPPQPAPEPAAQSVAPAPAQPPAPNTPAKAPPMLPPVPGLEAVAPATGVLGNASGLQMFWGQTDDGLTLRFDWHQPVAASVFRRGSAVWIVFDKSATIDLAQFAAQNLPIVTAIRQVPADSGLALRLSVWNGFNAAVRRAGNSWLIDFKNEPPRVQVPIQPQIGTVGKGAGLVFPVLSPSGPIRLTDPDLGDTLVAVPLPQLGQGVQDALDVPDIVTLVSVQGLAFRPISDRLVIQSDAADVTVSADDGLFVSPSADREAVAPQNGGSDLFHFVDWMGPAARPEVQQRQMLQQRIEQATSEPDRNAARLDLVKFYDANALGAEALGVLAAIQRSAPDALDEPLLRGLRGTAEELLGRTDQAAADFNDKDLDGRQDAQLWRGVVAADQGNWSAAAKAWIENRAVLARYPERLRRRLEVKFAEALVNDGKYDEAQAAIADVLAADPLRGESDTVKMLAGRVAAVQGDTAKAMTLWGQVDTSPLASLARAQAGYALILAKLQVGQIQRKDAIASLERLRFAWRGDDFEVRMLRKLGELQVEDGDYRDGFVTLRRVLTDFPDSPYAQGILQEMQQDFTDIFLGPNAADVPAVTALALYDEFRTLTPPGPQGSAVVRRLADRLVTVDLLDRAAQLLEGELEGDVVGREKTRLSSQLAGILLLNGKPQDALDALHQAPPPAPAPVVVAVPVAVSVPAPVAAPTTNAKPSVPSAASPPPAAPAPVITAPPPPPPPPPRVDMLAATYHQLLGEALLQSGKYDDALAAVKGDDSADADKLRADIYWKTHNWKAVSAFLLREMKPPAADGSVDPDTANLVMDAATAQILGGDQAGLVQLQKRYAAGMAKTRFAADFQALAGGGVPDPRTLATLGDQVSDLQSFMGTFRQKIIQGGLDAID